jgi:hypothetical protein
MVGYLLVAIMVAVTLIGAWMALQPPEMLTTIATPVLPEQSFLPNTYVWLPGDELIAGSEHKLWRWNIRTQTKSQIKGIVTDDLGPSQLSVSPNGQWLTWPAGENGTGWNARVTNLNAPKQSFENYRIGTTSQPFRSPHWSPDSRCFIDVVNDGDGYNKYIAVVFDLKSKCVSRTVPVDDGAYSYSAIGWSSDWVVASGDRIFLVDILRHRSGKPSWIYVVEYKLDVNLHEVRNWAPASPIGTIVEEVKISPAGDRLAWLVRRDCTSPWDALLARFAPNWSTGPVTGQELWVSSIEGNNMRKIGDAQRNTGHNRRGEISDLRWRPDGVSVSFLSDATFYEITAR